MRGFRRPWVAVLLSVSVALGIVVPANGPAFAVADTPGDAGSGSSAEQSAHADGGQPGSESEGSDSSVSEGQEPGSEDSGAASGADAASGTDTGPSTENDTSTESQINADTPTEDPLWLDGDAAAESEASARTMPLAAGDPMSCSYGNTGQGQFKDTLCWFDLSYMEGATKKPIDTTWNEKFITPDSAMELNNGCTRATSWRGYNYTCTATSIWGSAMGVAYGEKPETRQGTGGWALSETTALNNGRAAARTAARDAARTGLHVSGGVYYGPVTNYPIRVTLPNSDYTFQALLDITAPAGTAANRVRTVKFPTYGQAFLGNGGFYTGASGLPALYQQGDAGNSTTTTTLKNIQMMQGSTPVSNYSVVMADAESTDTGEWIRFSQSGGQGLEWLPNNPGAFANATPGPAGNAARKTAAVGNACGGTSAAEWSGSAPLNLSSVTCTGASGNVGNKTGTAMLQALSPADPGTLWSTTQEMRGSGLQGVAFGVLMSRASVNVQVNDRVIDAAGAPTSQSFAASVAPAGSAASTASTGASAMTASASPSLPVPESGTQLNFASIPNAVDGSYSQRWQCTKTGGASPSYWPEPANQNSTSASAPAPNDPWFVLLPNAFISCTVTYTPPYVTLVKEVDQNDTTAANVAADWDLTLNGTGDFAASTSNSTAPGASPGAAGVKRAIAANSADPADVYALTEAGPNDSAWQFGYDWTDFACVANSGSADLSPDAVSKTIGDTGSVESATLKVSAGQDLTCTFTNTANKPELTVKKEAFTGAGADPADKLDWNTAVDPSSTVLYKLTFDNRLGTAPMTVDYTDYLNDVLDDAAFDAGSIRVSDGAEAAYPAASITNPGLTVTDETGEQHANRALIITGSVPARAARTVWFSVTTLSNGERATARQSGVDRGRDTTVPNQRGYALNNYLVETGEPVPAVCAEPQPAGDSLCTQNPLRAWTVRKDSQPMDGAMIHTGGNIYYNVRVTNYSGEALTGVQLQDKLTETFAATRLDVQAPPAVPWQVHGVTFYTEEGVEISRVNWAPNYVFAQEGANDPAWDPATAEGPRIRFSGDASFDPSRPNGIAFPAGTWTYETPAFDFPEGAAYALVGYAVKGGTVANPADARSAYQYDAGDLPAVPNAVWINTAQALAAKIGDGPAVFPNRCSAEGAGVPVGDIAGYYDCKTWHSMGESYFHLWKKSASEPANGFPSGANITGSKFVIADTYEDALAGTPSRWLCRTNNNPNSADWVPAGSDPAVSGAPDWGASSDTWDAIAAWNVAHPSDQRDQCGRFFHLDAEDQGQAAGSWRALDIRGGDTVSGGTDPLPKWRTESAYNNGVDATDGRHGTYWVVETQAPEGHQLLPKPFQLWVAPNSPTPAGVNLGSAAWYDYQGRLSIPYTGVGEPAPTGPEAVSPMPGSPGADGEALARMCVNPWQLPANNQVACVMPTGWTMPVFNSTQAALPLTGGWWLGWLTTGGVVLLLGTTAAVLWWRRTRAGDMRPVHEITPG